MGGGAKLICDAKPFLLISYSIEFMVLLLKFTNFKFISDILNEKLLSLQLSDVGNSLISPNRTNTCSNTEQTLLQTQNKHFFKHRTTTCFLQISTKQFSK